MTIKFKDFLNEENQQINEGYRAPKVPKEFDTSSDMEAALAHVEELIRNPMTEWAEETDGMPVGGDCVQKLDDFLECLEEFEELLMDASE